MKKHPIEHVYLKDFYEKQGQYTPIGAQYSPKNIGLFDSGTHFYFNERFNRSVSLLSHITDFKNLKALDIRCGSGIYSLYFSKRGAGVMSFDLSKNYLLKTKDLCSQNRVTTRLVNSDVCFLPFKEKSFDLIISLRGARAYSKL